MKTILKFFFLGFFLSVCFSSYAQITVDSQEHVLFGKNRTWYDAISITDEKTTSGGYPFRIVRTSNDNVYFNRETTSAVSTGIVMYREGIAMGNKLPVQLTSPYPVVGIYTKSGTTAYGPALHFGIDYGDAISIRKVTPNQYKYVIDYYAGSIANSFRVTDDGIVTARGLQLASDISLKSEIETLTNPLGKLMQLRGVTYYMDNSDKMENLSFEEQLTDLKKKNPKIKEETLKQMQKEKKQKDIGVIAQEVEKVLPEAVSTNEDGLKSVSYSDLTVLLIEAVKEQQTLINQLNQKIENLEKKVATTSK